MDKATASNAFQALLLLNGATIRTGDEDSGMSEHELGEIEDFANANEIEYPEGASI